MIKLPHIQFSGRYKLQVRRQGRLIRDTGWFDNLITDEGLESLGLARDIGAYVMVGTGNAPPLVTDLTLQAQVASHQTNTAPNKSSSTGVETSGTRYGWTRLTMPFAQGVVIGNIAEVGIGWDSTHVFSRSLVNPPISIIAIDQLTVVYELRMYLPTSDVTGGPISIGGQNYNYTIRPIRAASTAYAGDQSSGWQPKLPLLGAVSRAWVQVVNSVSLTCLSYGAPAILQTNIEQTVLRVEDGSGTTSPSPSGGANPSGVQPTNQAYVPASLRCEFSFFFDLDRGNIDGGQYWTSRTSGTANNLNGIVFGGTQFVAVGAAGTILTSPTGVTWTSRTSGTAEILRAIAYDGTTYVAVGDNGAILSSTNGITWTPRTSGTANALRGITFAAGQFVVVGASGTILTSPTGATWTSQTSGVAVTLNGVTYGAGVFVAVGASGAIISSPNATAWTSRSSGTSSDLNAVTFGVGIFMAVGASGIARSSFDGFTWSVSTTSQGASYNGIIATNLLLFAVGSSSVTSRTAAGTSWSSASTGTATHRGIAFGVKTLVAVADSGVIYTASAGGIQGFIYTALFGTYQAVLDGVIDKDNTKTLTMVFEQTWARRP